MARGMEGQHGRKICEEQKEEGLSYQQNPAYIQKTKSHPPFHKTKANYSVGSTNCRKPEVKRRKTTALQERKETLHCDRVTW